MPIKHLESSPADSGFRMPAEWCPHAATWLSWPQNKETWPRNLAQAQQEYLAFVKAIANDETVVLNFASSNHASATNQKLAELKPNLRQNIQLSICPTNDAWIRDYGPTFVTDGKQLAAIDWRYNAWGGKYPPYDDDQKFVERMLSHGHSPEEPILYYQSQLCFEGGAIEVDDAGVAMCTKSCVLDSNRNPDWKIDRIEAELKNCLGLEQVIWLTGDAITGDDTDGHIDQLARFVPGKRILYACCEDSAEPQSQRLDQNFRDLVTNLSEKELEYELIPLPLPEPVVLDGVQLPASYCNFYVTNESVIVPTFDQSDADKRALAIIGDVFDDRKIVALPSVHLCWGLGSFHCLTQQQPAVTSN